MEYFILTMNDFGKAMRHLKVYGKKCFGREKELVQGIILVAVAFAHAQKDELSIGIGMLGRVLEIRYVSFNLSFN